MGSPPTGTRGPHVVVSSVDDPVLEDGDRHHLEGALRCRPGDALTVTDGAGRWRACELVPDGVRATADPVAVEAPHPRLCIGAAITKGSKPELVVQKLVELGIDDIVVFAAARSVARWDAGKTAKQQARLERVAREAVMQSRRVWMPSIVVGASFAELAGGDVALAQPGGNASLTMPDGGFHQRVLIGPEGGWSDEELASTPLHVDLGPTVLRAETAAIATAALLTALRAGRVQHGPRGGG